MEEEEEDENDVEDDVDDNEKDEQGKEAEEISCGASKFTDRPEAEVDNNDEEEVTLVTIVVGILSQSTIVVVVLLILVLLVATVVIIRFGLTSLIISEENINDDEDIAESESLEEILNEFGNLPELFVESLSLI